MNIGIKAEERAAVYEMLASCYLLLPTKDQILKLPELLKEAANIIPEVDFGELISEAETRYNNILESNEYIQVYTQEFYDHFLVTTTQHFIPAYESVIRKEATTSPNNKNGKKQKYNSLWRHETHHVLACYNSVSFNPSGLNLYHVIKEKNVPDYFGLELAFMAYLCASEHRSANTQPTWRNLQIEFLTDHLYHFTLDFDALAQMKANPYYKALAKATKNFVTAEFQQQKLGGDGLE
jgi:TorA maturation chaperone TorD